MNRLKQKKALLVLEDQKILIEKDLLESRCSQIPIKSDCESDTILSRLKRENNWPDLPQTSKDSMSTEDTLAGYDTDGIESEQDQTKYFTKIKEKIIYCLDNKMKFSEAFTDLYLKELDNLDLSEEHQEKLYELEEEKESENIGQNVGTVKLESV